MPQWVTIFPQFSDLPPTLDINPQWTIRNGSNLVAVETANGTTIRHSGTGTEKADLYLESIFLYQYVPPKSFNYALKWESFNCSQRGYSLELILNTPDTQIYSLCDSYYGLKAKKTEEIPLLKEQSGSIHRITGDSWDTRVVSRLKWQLTTEYPTLASKVLQTKGEYHIFLHATFDTSADNSTSEIALRGIKIGVPGLVHGVLGSDQYGGDLFSQLVYSTQTSLLIGLLTALSVTVIGVVVGVLAGYVGGIVDEICMRMSDLVLCIPMLPILITLATLFGANMTILVLLLSLLWWPGEARVIRSRVLSLREKAFIVSAKAVGASRAHIMLKHIMPNVLPLAFAALILNVPYAVITEAVISFIGLTPLAVPTWGKMLHYAFYAGAFQRLAWWWIIPPGIALTMLSLAFVFVGHAVDEIVNPRLRTRR